MPIYSLENKKPKISKSAFIAENAIITGDITIGDESSIWFSCVARADIDYIKIGNKSNIQDLTMLHVDKNCPLIIGNMVTVGHGCVIHGATIEDDCLIGMGATVMSGAKIGRGSIVAGGAVVLENMQVPPFSLVTGVPAKVKRTFDESIIEKIHMTAKSYLNNMKIYKDKTKFIKLD